MFQQVTVIGRLGRDPEQRSLPSGASVANFSVATTERWKDKQSGEQQERTEWFNCTAFGRTAEIAAEYLHKGDVVTCVGKLRTEEYEKDGVTKYSVKLIVDKLVLMPNGQRGGGERDEQQERPARRESKREEPKRPPADSDFDDDIPF